ncbi:MAG: S-methyl-5-thioribose-1-phosphate isomerase [Gammaproteobacteria bacterium]|nr:S-methyl-5-thioribose-1-phosphate isomerase [Gammaproteobacteria bacterium]
MDKSLPNRAIEWRDRQLILLDQRLLPSTVEFLHINSVPATFDAIKDMVVRGAPAIGVTAAYGVVLSALKHQSLDEYNARQNIQMDMVTLAKARPTAVNLAWALQRMQTCLHAHRNDWLASLEREAITIHKEDIAANKTMGELGASYIDTNSKVMTHCNAGALATGGYGTALGVIRSAFTQGKLQTVFANETRPWFQGSRLTAWELEQENIPVNLICDSAAASALRAHNINWIIVGADRIAANGDVANKIGTYGLAVLAKHLGKKFMVVAPTSTIDLGSTCGEDIKIEERESHEVTHVGKKIIATEAADVWNPVFDVTPAELIDVLITERGAVEKPSVSKIAQLFANKGV